MTNQYTKVRKDGIDQDVIDAFNSHVEIDSASGCHLWTGPITVNGGYGEFTMRSHGFKTARAHRVGWQIKHRCKLTPDIHVLHSCDNRLCVNADHLFLGDQVANMHDMAIKGRQAKGINHPKYIHGRYIGDNAKPEYSK